MAEEDIMNMSCSSNLLDATGGWSSEFEGEFSVPEKEQSFDSILRSYTKNLPTPPMPVGTPELSNMLARVYGGKTTESSQPTSPPDKSESGEDDFEVIPKPKREDERTLELLTVLGNIPREMGLDQQNFECYGCKCSIGMIFGPYSVCALDGRLYCRECFPDRDTEEHVIPSRVIHGWDFRAYPVCTFNKNFLIKYEQEPLLDLRELNPSLYTIVPELEVIQRVRRQLGFLRLYLFSCSESVADQLKKMIWPREYLYEHVHLYSTLDLLSVPSGVLSKVLDKAGQFARKHVISCQLCSQKGFICELCSDPRVIFPFDMDTTHYCEQCSALYHIKCMQDNSNACNKCERRRIRMEEQGKIDMG